MKHKTRLVTCLKCKSLLISGENAIEVGQEGCDTLLSIHNVQLPIRLLVHPYLEATWFIRYRVNSCATADHRKNRSVWNTGNLRPLSRNYEEVHKRMTQGRQSIMA